MVDKSCVLAAFQNFNDRFFSKIWHDTFNYVIERLWCIFVKSETLLQVKTVYRITEIAFSNYICSNWSRTWYQRLMFSSDQFNKPVFYSFRSIAFELFFFNQLALYKLKKTFVMVDQKQQVVLQNVIRKYINKNKVWAHLRNINSFDKKWFKSY